ncbi:MAG: rhomboid family intramembrane serine protease [Elusimicrobiota bacterium]|jgi:membrane associated rhomboid family serine protease
MIPLRDNAPSKKFPAINWLIILANAYCFYRELTAGSPSALKHIIDRWAVVPPLLFHHGEWYRLLTATFLHGGWLHIASNMLFLYIFGDAIEDKIGHLKYLFFYLFAGVVANFAQAFMTPSANIPMLGASGAIAGVLGAYFFFYPYARILTLIPILFFITIREVPAFIFLGIWFFLQTFNGAMALSTQLITNHSIGGIAWWAHAGGFMYGILLAPMLGSRTSKYR